MSKPEAPVKSNKLIICPMDRVKPIRASFIVKDTNAYCLPKTKGGLLLPEADDADMIEKKYRIGEVVAAGPECVTVKEGDIVVYMTSSAWRVPNGYENPIMYKMEESAGAVCCVMTPPTPEEAEETARAFSNEAQATALAVATRTGEFEPDAESAQDAEVAGGKRFQRTQIRYDDKGNRIEEIKDERGQPLAPVQ